MNPQTVLLSAALLPMVWPAGMAGAAAAQPNIIVIFADDLDFREVAALAPYSGGTMAGQAAAKGELPLTPNLDRLVSDSLVFTQFHVAATVCTPSRYALLTGQYGSRSASLQKKHPVSGAANVEFNTEILPGQWHLALGLKEAGYATGIVGKWHLTDLKGTPYHVEPPICNYQGRENGPQDPALPENAGRVRAAYEASVGYLRNEMGWDYVSSIYMANASTLGLPKPLWQHESNMEWFTAGALKFLEQQKGGDKPFFLYFAPNIPHGGGGEKFARADPRGTPEGWVDWHLGAQPERADVVRRVQEAGANKGLAWAAWLDDGIGVILKKLDELGLAEDTAVIFSSDQQSDGKWTCYEGARVPLAVRWPGKAAPGRNDTLLSSIDLAPTLLEIAGASVPPESRAVIDGRSFAAALRGGSVEERPVLIEMGYGRAVIGNGWKYIAKRFPPEIEAEAAHTEVKPTLIGRFRGNEDLSGRWPSFGDRDELFELRKDPLEQNNLARNAEYASKLAEMRGVLKAVLARLPHAFGEFKEQTP